MIDTMAPDTTTTTVPEGTIVIGTADTPRGPFGAVYTSRGLACLTFPDESLAGCEAWVRKHGQGATVIHDHPVLATLSAELTAYFEGTLRTFSLPLDLRGTPFQLEVWQALQTIPYGEVSTYGAIAKAIGRPRAVRAVGMANHSNPVAVIVPCHRVVGSNGALIGYGGGLELKQRLLQGEGVVLGPGSRKATR